MSLYKRLHDVQAAPSAVEPREDATADIRSRIHAQLINELGPLLYNNDLSDEQLERKVRELMQGVLIRERAPLSVADRNKLVQDLIDDVVGYGPIDKLLKDESISDIMVNGPSSIYIEQNGAMVKSDVRFADETQCRRIIDKIVSEVGRRIDESTPMCDARLPDGSRVNAVIHPLAVGGPYLTIRKFGTERLKIDDFLRFNTLTPIAARFLQACIVGRLNIVVSGGSGTGKTSMLNVLSGFIPEDERIITVEDSKELRLDQDHVLALESRPPNVDGKGEITIRELVKNTLRMRPDRIVVGEVRSGEALDMLQAMNTGHDGSVTSCHSNSPKDTLSRIETLVLMSGYDLPVRAIREQMSAALDLIVHMQRLRDGSRRITQITEVQGMEGDNITLQDIFTFDFSMGTDDTGKSRGRLKATGVKPKFAEKLSDHGIKLPAEIFKAEKKDNELPRGSGPIKPDGGITADAAPSAPAKKPAAPAGAGDRPIVAGSATPANGSGTTEAAATA